MVITVLVWSGRDLGLGLDLWDFGGLTLLIFFLGGGGGGGGLESGLFLSSWGPKFIWLFLLIFFFIFLKFLFIFQNFLRDFLLIFFYFFMCLVLEVY